MKKCKKCDKEHPFSMFHKDASSKDGLFNTCKECKSRKDRKIVYQEIVAFDFYE